MQKILPIIFNSRGGGGGGAYLIQAHLRGSLIGLGGLFKWGGGGVFNLERTMVSVLSIKNYSRIQSGKAQVQHKKF